jgi:nitroreductase
MNKIDHQATAELIAGSLAWRYATKQYDPTRKLSEEERATIKSALRLAPSSYGLEAWKFIHVTDPKLRAELKAAAYGQTPLTDAADIFILAAYKSIDTKFIEDFVAVTAKTRGLDLESLKSYQQMMIGAVTSLTPEALSAWLTAQVYIPLGSALLAAAELGVDATPMEGFDRAKFNEILGLASLNLEAKVILALGFRAADDHYQGLAKVRQEESVVFIEK